MHFAIKVCKRIVFFLIVCLSSKHVVIKTNNRKSLIISALKVIIHFNQWSIFCVCFCFRATTHSGMYVCFVDCFSQSFCVLFFFFFMRIECVYFALSLFSCLGKQSIIKMKANRILAKLIKPKIFRKSAENSQYLHHQNAGAYCIRFCRVHVEGRKKARTLHELSIASSHYTFFAMKCFH